MLKYINSFFQYVFGFSYLGFKTVHGVSKKALKLVYDRLVVILPFLSQAELLGWSKNLSNGVETIYDKAMDAEFIKTGMYRHPQCDPCRKAYLKRNNDKISALKKQRLF